MTNHPSVCQTAFRRGIEQRRETPLREGYYKLKEARGCLMSWQTEVKTIAKYRRKEVSRHALNCCMPDEISSWLKECPDYIAHLIGYKILPGIAALALDGVRPNHVRTVSAAATAQATTIIDRCEAVRAGIAKNISLEYELMQRGESCIQPLIEEAIRMVDAALSEIGSQLDVGHDSQSKHEVLRTIAASSALPAGNLIP